jgi:hypothetical protein
MSNRFIRTAAVAVLAIPFAGELSAADVEFVDEFTEIAFVRAFPQMRPGKPAWSPAQMEGPPDVRAAGDSQFAWASASQDGQVEWIVCEYASAVKVQAVWVYENLAPGALVKVTAFDPAGKEVLAWQGKDPTPRTAPQGISVIPVRLDFAVQRIKLYLDSPAVPNWNEIDAVGLEDSDGTKHWAAKARASSIYGAGGGFNGNPPYAPSQATGEPDTPAAGDRPTAWTGATPDGRAEWLALEFETPEKAVEIVVYENNAPGAITKISVFDQDGRESVAWEGVDPTPRSAPWGVSVFPLQSDFPIGKVKLHIDSANVPGFNEIDAVGLRSGNRQIQWAKNATASSSYGQGNFGEPEPVVMPASKPAIMELADELKRLKQQVEELQQGKEELQKLMKQLKEKLTDAP